MHLRALLLGSVALAGLSSVAFAAEMGGAGGGGAPSTMSLDAALASLDPASDADWNKGGQPELERVRTLTGDRHVDRAAIQAAAPDLSRETAVAKGAASADDPGLDEEIDPVDPEDAVVIGDPVDAPAAPAASSDEPPAWAKQLLAANASLHARLDRIETQRGNTGKPVQSARDVIDGPLSNVQAALDPNAPDSADRPYAAPTSMAQAPSGSSADVLTGRQEYEKADFGRARADLKGRQAVKGVEMVAIAIGYYEGIKPVGSRFMFSGIPGSWMIRADDPELPLFIAGAKDQDDARAKWGLSIG